MRSLEDKPTIVRFGRFELVPYRRDLLVDGTRIELGSRAVDLLMVLVEAQGVLVTKDEILAQVWPDAVVEEANIQVQISTIRKAFGKDRNFIRTVPGRGYQFVAEVTTTTAAAEAEPVVAPGPTAAPLRASRTNLPASTSDLIGREAELAEVEDLIARHRLVTLTGSGGIGKSRLGLAVGSRLLPTFADGVWLAELAPLSDPQLVPATVATALGLQLTSGLVSPRRVADALGPKRLLLVLDNCEHLIDVAAGMAEALLLASSSIRILATSREPLGAEGECVYRVPPLGVPAAETNGMATLLQHGAVRLFVARARDADLQFSSDPHVVAIAAAVCRRLDGIPLAIEFAAARAATLGVEGVAARLDDRFRVLTGGRRTALPRQQTLRATLDWSHDLLPEMERVVLRRLAVFAGSFTLAAAGSVAASGEIPEPDIAGAIAQLVAKSLVAADVGGAVAVFRLLDTTRAYALEKLVASGEHGPVARRHAEYYREVLGRADTEWETQPAAEWLASQGRRIDNLRAALGWAFGPGGDPAMGVEMVAAATRLWINLSLLGECRSWIETALPHVDMASERGQRQAMRLQAALGMSLAHTQGFVHQTADAWNSARELAERLLDTEYRLQAHYGLYAYHLRTGEYRQGLQQAQAFRSVAEISADTPDVLTGDRIIGTALQYAGDLPAARASLERVLANFQRPGNRWRAIRFGLDQRTGTLIHLARVLWLQGFPERAMRVVRSSVQEALAVDHPTSICFALADGACPIAAVSGDVPAWTEFIAMLIDRAARHSFDAWHAHGRELQDIMSARLSERAPLSDAALERLREARFDMIYLPILNDVAGRAGARADACVQTVSAILERAERNRERWCIPELLRIKGQLTASKGTPESLSEAVASLEESLRLAREQQALAWELRSATSLARLRHAQGRGDEAYELVAPVYARFSEGFATADLRAAAALLDETR